MSSELECEGVGFPPTSGLPPGPGHILSGYWEPENQLMGRPLGARPTHVKTAVSFVQLLEYPLILTPFKVFCLAFISTDTLSLGKFSPWSN